MLLPTLSRDDLQHVLRNVAAGAGARMSSSAILFPFDTVKVHLQYTRGAETPMRTALHLVQSHGFAALYRGYLMRLIYIGPSAAVSFTIYDEVKQRMLHEHNGHPLTPVAIGVVLRMAGTGLRTPFDLVKQQLQLRGGNTSAAVVENVAGGVPFMLRGYTITVLRDGLFSAAYFTIYEAMKLAQRRVFSLQKTDTRVWHHSFAGAIAGAVGSVLTAPLDTVKTRIQTQNLQSDGQRLYAGMLDAIRRIYREEGAHCFFRGLSPRLVMISASGALTFSLYEQYKQWLDLR